PILATFLGDYRYNDLLPDISATARAEEQQDLTRILKQLDTLPLDTFEQEDRITADMLRLAVQAGLDALRLRLDEMSVDQMDGPQVWLLELLNWHPIDTSEHVEDLIERYSAFGS